MNHFVLCFKGDPLPTSEQALSKDAVKLLSLKIIQEGGDTEKVEALAAILKPNSNYVITFTNNIPPKMKPWSSLSSNQPSLLDTPPPKPQEMSLGPR